MWGHMKVECCWWSLYTGKPKDKWALTVKLRGLKQNKMQGLRRKIWELRLYHWVRLFKGKDAIAWEVFLVLHSDIGYYSHVFLFHCFWSTMKWTALLPVYSIVFLSYHKVLISAESWANTDVSSCKFFFLRCFVHRYAKVRNIWICSYTVCCLIFDTTLA